MQKLEKNISIQEVSTWATRNNYSKPTIKLYIKYYKWAQKIKFYKQMANMSELIKWTKWQTYLLQQLQYSSTLLTSGDIFVVLNSNLSDQKFFALNFCHIKQALNTIFFEGFLSNDLMTMLINNPYTKNIIFNVNYYTTLSKQFYQAVNLIRDLKLSIKIFIVTPKALNWNYFEQVKLKIMLIENEKFQIRHYYDYVTYINTNKNKYLL